MDLFNFDDVKAHKAEAMLWYNHLQSFRKLFRLIELCLALILLSWIYNRLPFAIRIAGEFFRGITGVIASPILVFVLCNAIIATLIAQSGRFSGKNPAADNAESELYEELLKNNENRCSKSLSENPSLATHLPSDATEEVEYQDKEIIITEIHTFTPAADEDDDDDDVEMDLSSVLDSYSGSDSDNHRTYRRSKSEKKERKYSEKVKSKKLRRSETERYIDAGKSTAAGEGLSPEDELSDEEFQRAVDEFIAKHLRFRLQESLEVVLQKQNSIPAIEKY